MTGHYLLGKQTVPYWPQADSERCAASQSPRRAKRRDADWQVMGGALGPHTPGSSP